MGAYPYDRPFDPSVPCTVVNFRPIMRRVCENGFGHPEHADACGWMGARRANGRAANEREETLGAVRERERRPADFSSFVIPRGERGLRTIDSFIHSFIRPPSRGWVVVLSDRGDGRARDDDGGDADARDDEGANERGRASSSIANVDRARQGG